MKLASGRTSTYYFNMKPTMLDAEGSHLIATLILDAIKGLDADLIGGLEMGAVPLASAVAAVSHTGARPINAFFVRKQAKEHGTKSLIEGLPNGDSLKGKRVVVVEDVTTTGGSAIKAAEAVRGEGAEVVGVVTVIDRQEGAGGSLRCGEAEADADPDARRFQGLGGRRTGGSRFGARHADEADELLARRIGTRDAHGEGQPQPACTEHQIAAFRVDARHAPRTGACIEQSRRVELDRVGVVLVHVRHDAGLGLDETLGAGERHQEIARAEIDDAAEAADEVRALELECVEREIGKIGVARRARMAREETRARRRARRLPHRPDQRDACTRHRIGLGPGAVDEQARARIGAYVLRVQREARNQEERRAVAVGCSEHQRGVRVA